MLWLVASLHFNLLIRVVSKERFDVEFISKFWNSQIWYLFVFWICTSAPESFPWLILHLTNTHKSMEIPTNLPIRLSQKQKINYASKTLPWITITTYSQRSKNQLVTSKTLGDSPRKPGDVTWPPDFKTLVSETLIYFSQKVLSTTFKNLCQRFHQKILV